MRLHLRIVLVCTILCLWSLSGCSPRRVDNHITLEGPRVMALMTQIGQRLEAFTPPEGGEGRVVNETQKVWHYLRVSPTTTLTLLRSRYTGWNKHSETVIATFKNPFIGSFTVNAQDQDLSVGNGVDIGHIKFTESVDTPSPGIARAEIYPFPRVYGEETLPPSFQLILPPGFVVPAGSDIDLRKRYIHDNRTVETLQEIVKGVFAAAQREVALPN